MPRVRSQSGLRAVALAFAPALLVVLAMLWRRSRRLYFEALMAGGPLDEAAPFVFAAAALTALLALWNLRALSPRDRGGRTLLYSIVAVSCAAAVVYLATAPLPQQHKRLISELAHGRFAAEAEPLLVVVLSLLVLSPLVVRVAGLARTLALPSILVPGALVGALAALDRPSGCEAVVARLLLAATLGLWMLLDLGRAHGVHRKLVRGGVHEALPEATASAPRRWRLGERAWFVLGVAACCGVAVWLTWPTWRPGIIINLDAPRHLLRAKIMAEIFLPAGHIDGWSPYWYLGAQLFLFQSYGYFFVIGVAATLLDGVVRLQDVFKFFYALPIVVLPAAVAWLARGLGAGRRAALAAAFASLALSSSVGYGIRGVYGTGLLLQGVGIVLFALVWPLVLDALDGRRRAAWTAALLLGAILVTHFITGAYVMSAAGVVAAGIAASRRQAAPLVRYAGLAIAALALSAHALFPSLELHDLAGGTVGWGDSTDRFARFLAGHGVGPQWFAVPAFVVALAAIARRRGRLALAALLLFGTAWLAASRPSSLEPDLVSKLLGVAVRPRALPYATLLTAVFVGVAFDAVLARIAPVATRSSREPDAETQAWPWRKAAGLVFCVVFVCAGVIQMTSLRSMVETEATLRSRDHQDYAQLARWLRANVPRPAIVEIERTGLPSYVTGARSVISILNLDTGLYTLGGDQTELTSAGSRDRGLRKGRLALSADKSARRLRSYGVSYVIATDPISRDHLSASAEYQSVYESQRAAVYRVNGSGKWLTGTGIESKGFRFAPERLYWQVSVRGEKTREATVAVSWHPNWQVMIDGEPVAVTRTSRQLVSFKIAPGTHSVDMHYVRRGSERVYDGISLAALLVVAVGIAAGMRRSRSPLPRGRDVSDRCAS